MIHNDFARRLKELEPEIRAVPNLWVLSGCDVDQHCWTSEGLGRTIFQYYISEALRGGGAAGSDGRLSLDELYRYVRENVRNMGPGPRGAVQEPVLLPSLPGGGGAAAVAASAAAEPARRDPKTVHLAKVEAPEAAETPPPPDREILVRRLAPLPPARRDAPAPVGLLAAEVARLRSPHWCGTSSSCSTGPSEAAQPVGEQLSQLEQAIRKDRMLERRGRLVRDQPGDGRPQRGAASAPADPPEFLKIAQAADDQDAQKTWDAIREGESSGDEGRGPIRPLRNRLAEYLLGRAQDDPAQGLWPGPSSRIRLTGLAGEPLPAEAHFLRMLQAKLSPPLESRRRPFPELAAQALRVRGLAERAAMGVVPKSAGYPYCEQVHAWTRQARRGGRQAPPGRRGPTLRRR